MTHTNFGPGPADETCAQIGSADYAIRAAAECKAWIAQLKRVYATAHQGKPFPAVFMVKGFDHDFGTYYEVTAKVGWQRDGILISSQKKWQEEAIAWLEAHAPANWDQEARQELGIEEGKSLAGLLRSLPAFQLPTKGSWFASIRIIADDPEKKMFRVGQARQQAVFRGDGPFRAPHHSVSQLGLLSEIALAAGGVLYLDEADEFNRSALRSGLRTIMQMDARFRPLVCISIRNETEVQKMKAWLSEIEEAFKKEMEK